MVCQILSFFMKFAILSTKAAYLVTIRFLYHSGIDPFGSPLISNLTLVPSPCGANAITTSLSEIMSSPISELYLSLRSSQFLLLYPKLNS